MLKRDIKVLKYWDLKTIKANHNWIIPQCFAHLAQFNPKSLKTSKDPLVQQILKVFKHSPRSHWLTTQSSHLSYAQHIPLILAAYKTYYNTPYHSWDLDDDFFLEPIHQVLWKNRDVVCEPPNSSKSSWFFHRGGCDVFQGLDIYSKHLICNTWLWHPQHYHHNQIHSLQCWDHYTTPPHNTSNIF